MLQYFTESQFFLQYETCSLLHYVSTPNAKKYASPDEHICNKTQRCIVLSVILIEKYMKSDLIIRLSNEMNAISVALRTTYELSILRTL
jgi:hypothetical protein